MQRARAPCDAFVASSASARNLLMDALPALASRKEDFHVVPHGRDFESYRQFADSGGAGDEVPLRILLPGNIGRHKGLEFIRRLKQLDADHLIEFHMLGSDTAEMGDAFIDHGHYMHDQFAETVTALPHSV